MGRSKFPGKPSKLVNKKRVSVLNGVLSNPFGENPTEFNNADYLANEQFSSTKSETTTTTIGHDDGDSSQVKLFFIFSVELLLLAKSKILINEIFSDK